MTSRGICNDCDVVGPVFLTVTRSNFRQPHDEEAKHFSKIELILLQIQ